jgi:hypothetical protein
MSLCAVGGACAPVWQARDEVAEYGLRAPKFLEFKADDGTTLYGRLLLPPESAGQRQDSPDRNIYGGPAAQMVLKEPTNPFDEILAREGFAIFPWTIAARRDATASFRPRFATSSERSS